ncbi:MAG: hypothetical protein ACRDQA_06890 [Nocardioidaceae bacterium]
MAQRDVRAEERDEIGAHRVEDAGAELRPAQQLGPAAWPRAWERARHGLAVATAVFACATVGRAQRR